MYGDPDLYRIKDIIHSLDNNHWQSKQWLVDVLSDVYKHPTGKTFVAGGWYGLLSYLLRQKYTTPKFKIVSADMDPKCEQIAWKLFPDQYIWFETMNVVETDHDYSDYTIIINTSCEHMDPADLASFIQKKPDKALLVLQTNNYEDLASHVNCSDSLEDFITFVAKSLPSKPTWYFTGELNLGDFTRYMVVVK
jgi:hypothetical protein